MDEQMENIIRNLVRIGTVSAVDAKKRMARVIYKDKDLVSGWLHVLQQPQATVQVKPDGLHTHTISGDVTAEMDGEHTHQANIDSWMPKINDTVLVLYLPVFNGDGFILGVI